MTVGRPTPVPRPRLLPAGDAVHVGLGGAAGAVARWTLVAGVDSTATFPWPTLLVNLVGCFVVGALLRSPRSVVMLLGIGFAGGLTTFSTFAVEVATLLDGSDVDIAASYLAASVLGGVGSVLLGHRLAPRW